MKSTLFGGLSTHCSLDSEITYVWLLMLFTAEVQRTGSTHELQLWAFKLVSERTESTIIVLVFA